MPVEVRASRSDSECLRLDACKSMVLRRRSALLSVLRWETDRRSIRRLPRWRLQRGRVRRDRDDGECRGGDCQEGECQYGDYQDGECQEITKTCGWLRVAAIECKSSLAVSFDDYESSRLDAPVKLTTQDDQPVKRRKRSVKISSIELS